MLLQATVEKILNFLISTNESGSQDHTTLQAAYKKFGKYLEENNIMFTPCCIVRLSLI